MADHHMTCRSRLPINGARNSSARVRVFPASSERVRSQRRSSIAPVQYLGEAYHWRDRWDGLTPNFRRI